MFHQTMFFYLKLAPQRHICLTQAVILSSTSNFFTTIAALYNKNMQPGYDQRFHFSPQSTLTDLSGNIGFRVSGFRRSRL